MRMNLDLAKIEFAQKLKNSPGKFSNAIVKEKDSLNNEVMALPFVYVIYLVFNFNI